MASKTTNYNLHKIDLADSPPDITVLNQNFDIIDTELKGKDTALAKHLDESNVGAHKAKNIALEDAGGLFVATELEGAMKELFTNVSNGKQLVGTAITDIDASKVVPNNPTFQQIADLIRGITTGKRFAQGTGVAGNGSKLIVNGLSFNPTVVIAQDITKTTSGSSNYSFAIVSISPSFRVNVLSNYLGSINGNEGNASISGNSFSILVGTLANYKWYAFE